MERKDFLCVGCRCLAGAAAAPASSSLKAESAAPPDPQLAWLGRQRATRIAS